PRSASRTCLPRRCRARPATSSGRATTPGTSGGTGGGKRSCRQRSSVVRGGACQRRALVLRAELMTTTLVTGANRGIGLELAKLRKAKGHDVIAVCRKSSPELDGLGVRVEAGIDVSDAASAAELKKRFADADIDHLIANAGILQGDTLDKLS